MGQGQSCSAQSLCGVEDELVEAQGELDSLSQLDQVSAYSSNYFERDAAELDELARAAKYEHPKADVVEQRPAHRFSSGAVYTGEWMGFERHGFGEQKFADGASYTGQWARNKAHGLGLFKHEDGDEYWGEWKQNVACGHGTFRHQAAERGDGAVTTFRGEFKNDLQDGVGEERWETDGSVYYGAYRRGVKAGAGKYTWSHGDASFRGGWRNNKIDGAGVYATQGKKYSGQWRGGVMDGVGTYE